MSLSLTLEAGRLTADIPDADGEVHPYSFASAPIEGTEQAAYRVTRLDCEGEAYRVSLGTDGRWRCTCPDMVYAFRRRRRKDRPYQGLCKHLTAAADWHTLGGTIMTVKTAQEKPSVSNGAADTTGPAYRDVPGFAGYRVGDDGSVWSRWERGRWEKMLDEWHQLETAADNHGYPQVNLSRTEGEHRAKYHFRVHRLVLLAFVGPQPAGYCTRHLNGDRMNNRLSNLAYGTYTENSQDTATHGRASRGERCYAAILSAGQVSQIRSRVAAGEKQNALAAEYGVSAPTVADIVAGRTWAHQSATDPREIRAALEAPFDADEVKFKPQAVKGNTALAIPYVDARVVMDRLDDVLGIDGWQDHYEFLADGNVKCTLSVRINGVWLRREDVGGESEQPDEGDRKKAAVSDALKRAAVKVGVGRLLYRQKPQWVEYDPQRRQFARQPTLPGAAAPPSPVRSAAKAATPPPGPSKLYSQCLGSERDMVAQGLCQANGLIDWLYERHGKALGLSGEQWPESARETVTADIKTFAAERRGERERRKQRA